MITFLIVCPLVFLAGFVDAIAGGGGLISLPAYMFAGIPVHNAIATNKLSSATGTFVSTFRLVKNKHVDWGLVPGTVICALFGSVIGANLALVISDKVLKTVLVLVLPVVAVCVLRDKDFETVIPEGFTRKKQYLIMAVCSLGIGIYDGFYGPGTGTFLLLVFTKLGKLNMEKATGNVKVVNLSSNISALVTFILAGKILWGLGLAASCFSIAGHYVGAGMVVNNGVKIIKPIILVVLVLLLIKVVMGL
nr:TSUP family transporter [uncultured Mediterraneibacter sp.]